MLNNGDEWDALPLAELCSLRTFVLITNIMDWKPDEFEIVQEAFISTVRSISPSVTRLCLHFYLVDVTLAFPECLLSNARWRLLDMAITDMPNLNNLEFALYVALDIPSIDNHFTTEMHGVLQMLVLAKLPLTAGLCFILILARISTYNYR